MKNSCKHQRLVEVKIPVYNHYTGDESIDIDWKWEDTFKDIEVNENYMDMWLKEMRNERGNPDYRFMIVDVVPRIYEDYSGVKEYISVCYIYGRL